MGMGRTAADGGNTDAADMLLLLPSCAEKFGTALALEQCLRFLAELFRLEEQFLLDAVAIDSGATSAGLQQHGNNNHSTTTTTPSLERCPIEMDQQMGPAIVHNRQHFHGPCTSMELFCLRFLFPLLQLLSLGGNVFNLLVYRLPYFGGSSAVHFLRAKALANLLFVQSRLLESLHAWMPLNAHLEWLYWYSRPWLITLGNLNGTIATWMTLLVCIETVVCVLWPFALRRLFSSRCTYGCLIGSISMAAAIHSLFLLTHDVVPDPSTLVLVSSSSDQQHFCFRIAHSFRMRPSRRWAPLLERPYYWVQMTLTIVLPTLAMLLCSALIVSRFTLKPQLGQAFSQRRKCVIRLTVATATSHLLLEGPGMLCYMFFAIRGADVQGQAGWVCLLSAANNFLSALNASIPCFLFLLCSSQFRHMSAGYINQWRASGAGGPAGSAQAKLSADVVSQTGGGGAGAGGSNAPIAMNGNEAKRAGGGRGGMASMMAHWFGNSSSNGNGGSNNRGGADVRANGGRNSAASGYGSTSGLYPGIGGSGGQQQQQQTSNLLELVEERRRLLTVNSWNGGSSDKTRNNREEEAMEAQPTDRKKMAAWTRERHNGSDTEIGTSDPGSDAND